jgi:RimJ/RimL family protein N-acetyltransferase
MQINFQKITDKDENFLKEFLRSNSWPFHENRDENFYFEKYVQESTESFWIIDEKQEKVGFIRIYDLHDDTPLFDLRLIENCRGRGIGTHSVNWMKAHIFDSYSDIRRIEGYTREDNVAMQKVFEKCGFIQEARHREAWPGEGDTWYDTIGYGILRSEYETVNL